MSLFWMLLMPAFLLFIGGMAFYAVQLKFFSIRARHLDQVDIPNEVGEVRLDALEMLVSQEIDFSKMTRQQRRQALAQRLQDTRKWLRLVISNATLFQEVARFHLQASATAGKEADDLPFKVMDRAGVVHFVAAACLIKLQLEQVRRILLPMGVPGLATRFQIHGYDLITWYRRLAQEMLELTKQHYGEVIYACLTNRLAGLDTRQQAQASPLL